MSGCSDVCVDMDYGGEPCKLYREREVVASRPWKCTECNEVIEPGAKYHQATGLADDGMWWVIRTCEGCADCRQLLACEGVWTEGELWPAATEQAFDELARVGLFECFALLKTSAGRVKLQEKFMAWKEKNAA